MPGRRRPPAQGARALVALGLAVLVLAVLPPLARATSASVTLGSSGSVDVEISASIPNGLVIREAMDGNFTPIVDAITTNSSQRSSILAEIASAESTPFLGSLFGNRDGTVEASEVTSFESLLGYEAELLPTGSISGGSLLAFTLDGARATSTKITTITFSNATGPAGSTGPMGVSTGLAYTFPASGSTHTLALTANVSGTPFPIALLTGAVNLAVVTPAGTSITGTQGFAQVATSNDPLGWGTSSVSGSYEPSTLGVLSVSYGPAFPTGDVLIVVPPIVAIAVVGLLLYRRRKKRAAASA
jgi:hypothetical protein